MTKYKVHNASKATTTAQRNSSVSVADSLAVKRLQSRFTSGVLPTHANTISRRLSCKYNRDTASEKPVAPLPTKR